MGVADPAGMAVVDGAVPDALHGFARPDTLAFHGFQKVGVDLLAPAVLPVADLQRLIEQILAADGEIDQPGQGIRCVVRAVHMNVDAAAAVGDRASFPQLPDDFLQVFHILVLEDRRHHFAAVIV